MRQIGVHEAAGDGRGAPLAAGELIRPEQAALDELRHGKQAEQPEADVHGENEE